MNVDQCKGQSIIHNLMFRASVCLRLCMWVRVYVFNSKNAFGENWPPPIVIRCMAWDRVHDCIKVAKYINELITIIYRYYCDFSILSPSIALAIVRTFWWRPVPWITEPADPATVSILTHIAQKKNICSTKRNLNCNSSSFFFTFYRCIRSVVFTS